MKKQKTVFRKRFAGMAEYIIILALVAIGSIAVFSIFGDQIRSVMAATSKQMAGDDSAQAADQTSGVDGEIDKDLGNF
jgi:Flp pilus assembly pilin Flp